MISELVMDNLYWQQADEPEQSFRVPDEIVDLVGELRAVFFYECGRIFAGLQYDLIDGLWRR